MRELACTVTRTRECTNTNYSIRFVASRRPHRPQRTASAAATIMACGGSSIVAVIAAALVIVTLVPLREVARGREALLEEHPD